MKYDFILNLKLNAKNWKNNVLKIFCLSLGIVMGSLFLYQFNGAVQEYQKNKDRLNFEDIVVLSPDWQHLQNNLPHERFLQPEELDQISKENDEILSVYFERLVARTSIIANKRFALASVSIINQDFNHLFLGNYLESGRWIGDGSEAVIGKETSKENNLKIGDEFSFEGNLYSVVGILDIPKYYDSILIPNSDNFEMDDLYFYVEVDKDLGVEELKAMIGSNAYDYLTGEAYFSEQWERLFSYWGGSMILAFATLLYSFINIANIERFFIAKHKRSIGIMVQLGAQKRNIVIVQVIFSIVTTFLACSLSLAIIKVFLVFGFGTLIRISVDLNAFIILFLIVQLIYGTYAYCSYKKILRQSTIQMIQC